MSHRSCFRTSASRRALIIAMAFCLGMGCAQRLPRPAAAPYAPVQGAACLELTQAWQEDLAWRAEEIFKISDQREPASVSEPVVNPDVDLERAGAWARLELAEWNRFSDLLGRQGDALTPAMVALMRFHAATERMDYRIMKSALRESSLRLQNASRTLCTQSEKAAK